MHDEIAAAAASFFQTVPSSGPFLWVTTYRREGNRIKAITIQGQLLDGYLL